MAEPALVELGGRLWRGAQDSRVRRPRLVDRPVLLAWLGAAAAGRCSSQSQRRLLIGLSELDWSPEVTPLLEAWVHFGLPRSLVQALGAAKTATSLESCGGERVYDDHEDGLIDLCFDTDWSPGTDEASRHETLAFVWPQYWSDMAGTLDVGLDFEALAACVRDWSVSDAPGGFWDDGSGPAGKVVLHALRLVATYIEHLSNDAPECPGARSAMSASLFRSAWIDVDRWSVLGADDSVFRQRNGLPHGFDGANHATTGKANGYTGRIHIGANYVEQMGQVVDLLLWQAHRAAHAAWAGRAPGSIVGALYYLQQARWLGSMALGGVATVANTIIHETMHVEVTSNHCSGGNNCCQERVAARWQCRTMAVTGALNCGYEDEMAVDLRVDGIVGAGSLCRDKASYEDTCADEVSEARGKYFCWSAQLEFPGSAASSEEWTKVSDWVSPAGCT